MERRKTDAAPVKVDELIPVEPPDDLGLKPGSSD